ncbi:hypothetical protein [Brassicibacter mesophilus]|uniref:hypothetical protein n=1 Tax=Brassicibacter mesophilus TaxID=745119 RepID=UPI003D23C759
MCRILRVGRKQVKETGFSRIIKVSYCYNQRSEGNELTDLVGINTKDGGAH